MSNAKQITISDTYGISKEWIESKKRTCENNVSNGSPHLVQYSQYMLEFITHIESQLFPIEPIVKDAWTKGFMNALSDNPVNRQKYLTQPITIKLE